MAPSVALAAAAMKAANFSKEEPRPQAESYAVVTFVDCRAILDPPLQPDRVGTSSSRICFKRYGLVLGLVTGKKASARFTQGFTNIILFILLIY